MKEREYGEFSNTTRRRDDSEATGDVRDDGIAVVYKVYPRCVRSNGDDIGVEFLDIFRLTTHFSTALGATVSTTTRLATINAVATSDTIMIVPLDAGNLPRIT